MRAESSIRSIEDEREKAKALLPALKLSDKQSGILKARHISKWAFFISLFLFLSLLSVWYGIAVEWISFRRPRYVQFLSQSMQTKKHFFPTLQQELADTGKCTFLLMKILENPSTSFELAAIIERGPHSALHHRWPNYLRILRGKKSLQGRRKGNICIMDRLGDGHMEEKMEKKFFGIHACVMSPFKKDFVKGRKIVSPRQTTH